MREIEFRAWVIEEKKYLHWDEMYGITKTDTGIGVHVAIADHCYFHGAEIILEQYTGLKSKYGAKIFEGDRLRISIDSSGSEVTGGFEGVVTYSEGCFWVDCYDETAIRLFQEIEQCEIIGNIHE